MLRRKTAGLLARLVVPHGGVTEWFKVADFKSVGGLAFPRWFESRPLRTGLQGLAELTVGFYHSAESRSKFVTSRHKQAA